MPPQASNSVNKQSSPPRLIAAQSKDVVTTPAVRLAERRSCPGAPQKDSLEPIHRYLANPRQLFFEIDGGSQYGEETKEDVQSDQLNPIEMELDALDLTSRKLPDRVMLPDSPLDDDDDDALSNTLPMLASRALPSFGSTMMFSSSY